MVSLVLVGFGNVGRAVARLLLQKNSELKSKYGLDVQVNGIITGKHGSAIDPAGISLTRALELAESGMPLDTLSSNPPPADPVEFIYACPADVMLESIPVNHHTGEPALTYLRTGIHKGMHAITANKGPVVHGYAELTTLAASRNRRFLFESAVMDGAPIFSLFRGSLPAVQVTGFQGILNSCTNLLLGMLEDGKTLEEAIAHGQSIGITETDPSADIDGWDAAIKIAALSTVIMGIPLKPQQVDREGIRSVTPEMIAEAHQAGERWKLVCTARREGPRLLEASIRPQRIPPTSPLYAINGTSSYVQFATDVLPGLG
ncbi:MAG: homoserine dehydrogenase, partial [Chloroflexi bacterium]|nr:homoserine dehydrogenase [Chloroflexota bacterium]